MTGRARFNPAPGWPAPPAGWTPEPGWRPDPGWPAAPSGWPLWVDEHGAPVPGPVPGPGPRPGWPRGRLIGIGAAVVVVVVVVAVIGVLVLRSSDDGAGANDPLRLTAPYATQPTVLWRLAPSANGGTSWGTPLTYYGAREDTGYLIDGRILIQSARGASPDRSVTGIDIDSGEVRWRSGPVSGYGGSETGYSTGCSPLLSGGRIACGGDGGFTFLSTRTGERVAKVPLDRDYDSVVQVGGTLAYVTATADDELIVTGGDDESATGKWRIDGPESDGNSRWDSNGTLGTACRASVRGSSGVIFDADGEQILPALHDDGCYRLVGDGRILNATDSGTTLFDATGQRLFRSPERLLYVDGDRPLAYNTDTGEVYSMPDGQRLWRSSLLTDAIVVGRFGDVLLLQVYEDGTPSVVALDVADGRERWRLRGRNGSSTGAVSDGTRVILSGEDSSGSPEILAVDLADGHRAWSLPGVGAGNYQKLVAAGDRLLLIGGDEAIGIGYP